MKCVGTKYVETKCHEMYCICTRYMEEYFREFRINNAEKMVEKERSWRR